MENKNYYKIRELILEKTNQCKNVQSINSTISNSYLYVKNKKICIKDLINYLTSFLDNFSTTLSERFYYIQNDIHDVIFCKNCQKNKPVFQSLSTGYRDYCSAKCSNSHIKKKEKTEETNLEKYGANNVMHNVDILQKRNNTNIERYGNTTPTKNDNVKNKMKKTNLERYGVKCIFQSEDVSRCVKEKNKEKFGGHPSKNENIKKKISNSLTTYHNEMTILEKQNFSKKISDSLKNNFYQNILLNNELIIDKFEPLFEESEYNGVVKQWYYWKCKTCGNTFQDSINCGKIPRCPICEPYNVSVSEKEVQEFLKEFNIDINVNNRGIIPPFEIDIFVPDKNLGIEFNGLYWHSEKQGKDKNYHLNKSIFCWKKKINLVHIFEDEWINKKETVQSILLNKSGKTPWKVYARKCKIFEVDKKDARKFLNDYHIQGALNSKYNFGLYYNDYLVSLITLGKPRFNTNYDYEIHRFCSYKGTNVIGGFSKLLKYSIKKLNIGSLITYADLRYGTGKVYRNNGFQYLKISEPNYFYIKSGEIIRQSRIQFQKHKLKDKLDQFYPNLSEYENMKLNGYDRIWDCGNAVYELINSK